MNSSVLDIQQREKVALRAGYGRGVRAFEVASIVVYAAAMGWLFLRLAPRLDDNPWLAGIAFLLGYLAADFTSGFVHWLADTWGTTEWPFIGKALIRPFREHHVDPKEITRHDFIETNGNNCFISLLPTGAAVLLPLDGAPAFFSATMLFSLSLWIFGTNQFHKWAHMDAPPRAAAWLQKMGLVLPPDHHSIHHTAPFARYYCITVGWLNEPLEKVRFFAALESAVSKITGLVPREDDIGRDAALTIAQRPIEPMDLPRLDLPDVVIAPHLPE